MVRGQELILKATPLLSLLDLGESRNILCQYVMIILNLVRESARYNTKKRILNLIGGDFLGRVSRKMGGA